MAGTEKRRSAEPRYAGNYERRYLIMYIMNGLASMAAAARANVAI